MRISVRIRTGFGLVAFVSLLFFASFHNVPSAPTGSSADEKNHDAALMSIKRSLQAEDSQKREKAMEKKAMTPDEILDLLRRGKREGYIIGDIPQSDQKARDFAIVLHDAMLKRSNESRETSLPEIESGRQDLILMRQPGGLFDNKTDHTLGVFLGGPEWSAIFYNELNCQGLETFIPGDDIDAWTERHRLEFQRSIPDYPMLGRIWDTYIDINYQREEVVQLRDECFKVKSRTTNPLAVQGLDKLLYACEQAIKFDLGLHLAAD